VVAEGVETEALLRELRLMRCDEMQFIFGKPVPIDIFEKRYLLSGVLPSKKEGSPIR